MVDLVAEGIDLGIRAGALVDSSLIAKKVGSMYAALYAAKRYVKKRGKPTKLAELADHDCVLFRGRHGHGTWQFEQPKTTEVTVEGIASVDDFWFMSRTIEAGLPGTWPAADVHGAEQRSSERVLPDHPTRGAPLHIVMPSASFVPARVAAVRDALHAHLTKVMTACAGKR